MWVIKLETCRNLILILVLILIRACVVRVDDVHSHWRVSARLKLKG
jgi:hypothetical protein